MLSALGLKQYKGSNLVGNKTSRSFCSQAWFGAAWNMHSSARGGSYQSLLLLHSQCRGHDHSFPLISFFSLIVIFLGIIKYGCTIHFKREKAHGFFHWGNIAQSKNKNKISASSWTQLYCYTTNQSHSAFLSGEVESWKKRKNWY